jgi:eukaryotic-like serine/threonine-protein kinase
MPLSVGQILNNRYRIVRLLGQGGFGAVYRAWDMNLDVPCAVKENLEVSQTAQTQFRREASLLATLHHPNLPRVTDHFFIPNQGQYLVMDFIEGDDLKTMLERAGGPLPEVQVLPWVDQVCDALTYLHNQQPPVIHRDIKPANIRITSKGQAMLVDFGIAKLYDANLATTQGARAITPGYSPQEQYGQGRTDERSDVYALGATLYTLLTGEVPVESVQRITSPLTRPTTVNPSISPIMESAILRAMESSPSERFQSAGELKAALQSTPALHITGVVATSSASVAQPSDRSTTYAPPLEPSRPPNPRWRLWAGLPILLVFLGVLGFLAFQLITRNPPAPTTVPGLVGSQPAGETATQSSSATPGSPAATRVAPPTPTPVLAPTVTPPKVVIAPVTPDTSYQQGKLAYVSRQNGYNQIYVNEPPGGSAIYVVHDAPQSQGSESPSWSPAGDLLAFTNHTRSSERRVALVSAPPNSQPKNLTANNLGQSPSWSPDGKQIIFSGASGYPGQFLIVDAATGKLVTQVDPGVQGAGLPAWSPDGTQIAFTTVGTPNSDIYVMPAGGGDATRLTNTPGDDYAPAWSPDGKWIAFQSDRKDGGGKDEIWIMDSSGNDPKQLTTTAGQAWARAPTWSPDGKWIAYISGPLGQDYGELYVIPVAGGNPQGITDTGGKVYDWRPTWGK